MAEKSQDGKQPIQESKTNGSPTNSSGAAAGNSTGSTLRKRFPTIGDLLAVVGIFFISQLISMFVAMAFGMSMPDRALLESTDSETLEAANVAVGHFNAIFLFVAMSLSIAGVLVYRHMRGGPSIVARFSAKGFNPMLLLWGIAMLIAVSVVAEPLMRLLPNVPDAYGRGVWAMITIVVMAPIFEEIFFRGILLESVRSRWGVAWAWFISSLIFGICHGHPTLVVNASIMGLVLGFIYIKTESIFSVMIIHAVNNAIAFLLISVGYGNVLLWDVVPNRTIYFVIYIVALVIFAASAYMIYHTLKKLAVAGENNA